MTTLGDGAGTQENRLWRLVRTLTPSEKRQFRLQSGIHGSSDKAYVRLFDAVDREEEPTPEELRRELGPEIADGSYHVLKNYLYQQILRVLRHHSSEASPETRVENHLQEVRILREKGLRQDALRILHRARNIAERWEMHAHLAMIASWKTYLECDNANAASQLSSYQERCRLLGELREYYDLEHTLGLISRELENGPVPPDSEERERFDRHVRDLDRDALPPTDAFRRRSSYHYIWATYAFGIYDLPTALEETRNLLELFRTDGHRVAEQPIAYLNVLNNHLLLLHRLGRTEELLEQFEEAEDLVERLKGRMSLAGNRIHEKAMASLWLRKALFRIDRNEYTEIIDISRRFDAAGFEGVRPETALDWSLLSHLCAIAYMMTGDNRRALDWNLRSIDQVPSSSEVMVFCVRALEVVLHIRLQSRRLLRSLLRRLTLHRPSDGVLSETTERLIELIRAMAGHSGSARSRNRLIRAIESFRDVETSEKGIVVLGHIPWEELATQNLTAPCTD